MALPKFVDDNQVMQLLQTSWASKLDPLLLNPLSGGSLLKSVNLAIGSNIINHKLGRKLQGWYIVRQRAASSIYDSQDSNQMSNLTLVLNSSAAVTVDIYVF